MFWPHYVLAPLSSKRPSIRALRSLYYIIAKNGSRVRQGQNVHTSVHSTAIRSGSASGMIDWEHIDTVLLDMDGTLLDLRFDNYFWMELVPKHYAARHDLSAEAARDKLETVFSNGVGTLNWYCLDHWSNTLNLDIPQLKKEVQHLVSIRPHVTEFLRQLHKSDRRVALVTNAHPITLEIKMNEVDITPWFDHIVVSHDLGHAKEELQFWQKLQAEVSFNPATTLLIDDTEPVLASAQNYGIAHLLTLLQPDSSQPKRSSTRFRGIHHFDEIMPGSH